MTKERFKRYGSIVLEIAQLEEDLEHWRAWAEKCVSSLGALGRGEGMRDRMADMLAKRSEIEMVILSKLCELATEKLIIEAALECLDTADRVLLRMHYCNGKTWAAIADELGYTQRWVAKLHDKALERLTGYAKTA